MKSSATVSNGIASGFGYIGCSGAFVGRVLTLCVTVSPSPQSKDEENEKLHELRRYARDFRRQHTTDAEQFDWDSDDGDYGLAIGRLVVT
jgi:F420-0:gamma-glutamyl ligase-like protein